MYTVAKLADHSQDAVDKAVAELLSVLKSESAAVSSEAEYKAFHDRWLARANGLVTQVNELWLKAAPPAAKRVAGQAVNLIKHNVTREITIECRVRLDLREAGAGRNVLEAARVDVTLPGIRRPMGVEHLVIRTMNDIVSVFRDMGYSVGEGPEVEADYYNFEALNFPHDHPARDTQDTIFIAGQQARPQRDRLLLRTHTSPVQIRTMEKQAPPVRIVIPGKVHRHDTPDATHSPVFHQVEGLAVDEGITFCDLKGTLDHAMKAFFGPNVRTKFQPSFFPFTEPSAEVYVSCIFCGGKGCRICKQSGWIELLGSGMVDPALYGFVGYDPEKVSGFAFGMGVERFAMLMYGLDDIQQFYLGDVRFLEQFA
jgi:phenylalanyl-tRNA synthetase alpha chain